MGGTRYGRRVSGERDDTGGKWPASLLVPETAVGWPARAMLFATWLILVAWLAIPHVPWKDEARAYALATVGGDWAAMLRAIHGEGHPALWYVILRALHDLWPSPLVLPVAGLMVGISAAALFAFRAPFRLPILVAVLFSAFLLFHHNVVARNYGLAALIMFPLAAWWPRLRDSPWFGVALLLLCNSAVPTIFLAGGLFLYRALTVLAEQGMAWTRQMRMLVVNGSILLAGALLCFLTVYPPANDAVSALSTRPFGVQAAVAALASPSRGFDFGYGWASGLLLAALSLAMFARNRPALVAAAAALVGFRLFFFFVYPASYRHSTQFLVFLIALAWMSAADGRARGGGRASRSIALAGEAVFGATLVLQLLFTASILNLALAKVPQSRARDLVAVMRREGLGDAVVTGQPDTALEPIAYQLDRDVWLTRQERFGRVSPLTRTARLHFGYAELLGQVERLHRRTGRPVVIAILTPLDAPPARRIADTGFEEDMLLDPGEYARFRAATRRLAVTGPAISDERYVVYAYPAAAGRGPP